MIKKFKIKVQMQERWIPYFMSMLKRMEYDGCIGHSENVTLYADGDGDFRPKFKSRVKFKSVDPVKQTSASTTYDAG